MSLATRILLGLLLGIGSGLFFGEGMAVLAPLGDALILLLQMTVLPYIVVSLVLGLGSVSAQEATSLAKRTGSFLLRFWALAMAAVFLMRIAFPGWESASFFSTNLIEPHRDLDFLGLFIPANRFHSPAEMTVPAVVVFSIALGIAMIGIEGAHKQSLVAALEAVSDALARVTQFAVGLAPYGVFAIAANAAGTLSLSDAAGLQVYAAAYIALAVVLTFWVKLRRYLQQAELVSLTSPRQSFRGGARELDALPLTAESGSAWCLIYPDFAVAVPQPDRLAVPLAYPVRRGDETMVDFLNHWIELKRKDQTIERLYHVDGQIEEEVYVYGSFLQSRMYRV